MALETLDGTVLDDAPLNHAQGNDTDPSVVENPFDVPAPAKRPVVDTTDPGYTPKPRRTRVKKDDPEASRTTDKPPADKKKALEPKDFTADLQATADLLWLGASSLPVAAPYAAVFHANTPALVQAVNAGAQVNHDVRNFCEKLSSGQGNAWVLQLGMVGVQMGMQMWSVMQNPEMRAQYAQYNTQQANEYMNALAGQMQPGA